MFFFFLVLACGYFPRYDGVIDASYYPYISKLLLYVKYISVENSWPTWFSAKKKLLAFLEI